MLSSLKDLQIDFKAKSKLSQQSNFRILDSAYQFSRDQKKVKTIPPYFFLDEHVPVVNYQ